MTPDQVKASYRKSLGDKVTVRRYTSTGTNRTKTDIPDVRARVTGYNPNELVGTIVQGDKRAIVFADDIISGGISDLRRNDKLLVDGREYSIEAVDSSTRKVGTVLIAYELQLRG